METLGELSTILLMTLLAMRQFVLAFFSNQVFDSKFWRLGFHALSGSPVGSLEESSENMRSVRGCHADDLQISV